MAHPIAWMIWVGTCPGTPANSSPGWWAFAVVSLAAPAVLTLLAMAAVNRPPSKGSSRVGLAHLLGVAAAVYVVWAYLVLGIASFSEC